MINKVLILGAMGMLGHTLFNSLSLREEWDVYATSRTANGLDLWFSPKLIKKIRVGVDADNFDTVTRAVAAIQPDIVINCIGLIKQLPISNDPISAITTNALFPHRLSLVCRAASARMIQISTDCVFDGLKGRYKETDPSSATDLYGRAKYLGEVAYPHCITLRSSIIGHELKENLGLLEWFLAQKGKVKGFTKAIYSGFPTIEFASIIMDYVFPNPRLQGVYHVSSDPVSKYDLLKLVAARYGKDIDIELFEDFHQDRSLDSSLFRSMTGYVSPPWVDLVDKMYRHYKDSPVYKAKV